MVRRLSLAVQCSLAILSLSAAPFPLSAQEDDPALRDRFLKGVAETARKLEHLSFRAKFVHVGSAEGRDARDKIDPRNYEVAIRGACGLETGLNEYSGTVFFRVRNRSYAFALDRSPKGKRTSLQFVEQIGINPSVDARVAEMEDVPRALALGAFYLWSDPLFRLVESDAFSIKRVYAVTSEAKQLVRVEFEYFIDDPARKRKYRVTDGFLVCDPARQWALTEYAGTEYNFVNKATSVMTAVLEHGETIGGIPIATKTIRTHNLAGADYRAKTVTTAEIIDRDVPMEEFYLTHYGLPEPKFRRSWFGAWVGYLIAGIVCLGVGRMILKRRRATG